MRSARRYKLLTQVLAPSYNLLARMVLAPGYDISAQMAGSVFLWLSNVLAPLVNCLPFQFLCRWFSEVCARNYQPLRAFVWAQLVDVNLDLSYNVDDVGNTVCCVERSV